MAQREEVYTQLEGILLNKLGAYPEDIREDADLTEDLGLDSLDKVELTMECEKVFSIGIDDELADGIRTVGQLVDAINERVENRS